MTTDMKMNNIFLSILLLAIVSCDKKNNYDASGSFEAVETMISTEVNGRILQLNIEEGQELNAGQVVAYIDSAQLYARKLQLEQNKKAILSGRPQTTIQTESLKKELINAVTNRDRTEKLVTGGV